MDFWAIVCAMRMLVIGSCTGQKNVRDCPDVLSQADFDDPSCLRQREAELSEWALPARDLYTGWQHRYMMNGVRALRESFGLSACSVKIISAGYGLADEEQVLTPYEATFQGESPEWVRQRSEMLGIPRDVRRKIVEYELVCFLLGMEYLISVNLPLAPSGNQRLIFFTSKAQLPFHPDSVIVPAGRNETRFGAGLVALKGKMFERFARGLCSAPEMWAKVHADQTPSTVLALIGNGQVDA